MVDRAGFEPATFRFLDLFANRTFFGPERYTRLNYRPAMAKDHFVYF